MFKRKLSLLLIAPLYCLSSLGASEPTPYYWLEYVYITPVTTSNTRKGKVVALLNGNSSLKGKTLYSFIYNNGRGQSFVDLMCKSENGFLLGKYSNYTFKKDGENRIKFFYYNGTGKVELNLYGTYDDRHFQTKVDKQRSSLYTTYDVAGYSKDRGYYITYDKYFFINWYAVKEVKVYNKFDVGMFTFYEQIGELKVPQENTYLELIIPTKYGLFTDLNEVEKYDEYVVLPLRFVDIGGYNYQVQLEDPLYVNPYTYEMSRTKQNGYVQTKYIYLPKNGFHDYGTMDFSIMGEDLGTSKILYSYNFTVEAEKSRIGNCVTSEYCIRSVDTSYDDFGKELKND